MSYFADVRALLRKDLLLELRARDTLPAMLLFVVAALVVFHFALPGSSSQLASKGLLWVADRENQRIQIFDADGKFIRESKYAGLPCSLDIGKEYIYMVNGFAGQVLRLTLDGTVLAATGKAGNGLGEFGEAHFVAVSPKGELYVADSVNSAVQKFVKK